MTRPLRWLLALTVALVGCDADPLANGGDDDPFARDPVTIPVIGHGSVTERVTAEVAVDGSWAYTTTWGMRLARGNAIKVWDVSGATPLLVDSVIVPDASTLGDVQISDDGSLLVVATEGATGSILILDRTDPAHPVPISRHVSENTRTRGVHTVKLGRVGGVLYAFLSTNPRAPTNRGQLVVVDLRDPANPTEILALSLGGPIMHDVFVRDGYLFTAEWDDGMSIWDVGGGGSGGSPADPVRLGSIATVNGNAHNVWWYHAADGQKRYVFVGEEAPASIGATSNGDIHVVDISDMTDPREVAFYTVANAGTHNFAMDEANGILYAAYYNGGVRAIDVRGDLGDCSTDQKDPATGRCNLVLMRREAGVALAGQSYMWGVALDGELVYASDMNSGIYKLNGSVLR